VKKVAKPVFFIIVLLIAAIGILTATGVSTSFGDVPTRIIKSVHDIRWGIDIRGGVDVTFSPPEGVTATREEMSAAESIIQIRLVSQNITDSEVYTDYDKNRIIVRFPWKAEETDFDPQKAIAELGATARLTFREGAQQDPTTGAPSGETLTNIILEGKDVKSAHAGIDENNQYVVSLELNDSGKEKFSQATAKIGSVISIWMDNTLISKPVVHSRITDGRAEISGSFDVESATKLANQINGGALPFALKTENYNTISPSLGMGAKDAMVLAGFIAFILVAILMIISYRLPGAIAVISLTGQIILMLSSITGFFAVFPSFTLTLPGIAGIILSIGMGVDANIITAERIREEISNGRTIDGAIDLGYNRAFTAIFDGNVTVIIVAIILMGAFGPPDSLFARMLAKVFFMFGPTTAGTIYSFGYTLLVGVILNLLMGVLMSRLMLKSISRYSAFRKPVLYGGEKA
jgi:protein-export membrane protein SecD